MSTSHSRICKLRNQMVVRAELLGLRELRRLAREAGKERRMQRLPKCYQTTREAARPGQSVISLRDVVIMMGTLK